MKPARRKYKFFNALMCSGELSKLEQQVAWLIVDRARIVDRDNPDIFVSWPGYKRMARDLGSDPKDKKKFKNKVRTVKRAVKRLVSLGWFDKKSGGGSGNSNRYYLNLERVAVAPPTHKEQRVAGPSTKGGRAVQKGVAGQPPESNRTLKESLDEKWKERKSKTKDTDSLGDTSLDVSAVCLQGERGANDPFHIPDAEAADMHHLLVDGLRAAGFGDKEAWEFLMENCPPEALAA